MPHITLFLTSLILGTLLSLSSAHWIFIWVGLELNLLSFIPLLVSPSLFHTSEAAMTYFLAQTLGSGLFLLGAMTTLMSPLLPGSSNLPVMFILLGLLTKLGFPPFHFWFPSVMSLISWPLCLLLTTWQKLTPLILLFKIITPQPSIMFSSLIALGALTGGVGGMSQTHLRPLLAYSSIGHMSWMLASSLASLSTSMIYLGVYILISIPLFMILWASSAFTISATLNISSNSMVFKFILFITMMSLGGLPPFLGFLPKLLVINSLSISFPLIILVTMAGSLLNLYYYLHLTFINTLTPVKLPIFSPSFISYSHPLNFLFMMMGTLTLGLSNSLFLSI
uniref:NADH-ubiquinone oxidoreductase chain 2 n=1 Tax=Lepidonotopodium sp. YZ-2018 TaxID=2153333 RepID=A0A343W675_9ANNE|nr:NADH dehydrogenase subunit 2 [Lepidonotopodium sp. YZ-2018]